ncbi:MAG TPA: phenylalanine--tRNA ligase subunit alpha [Candidatus Onthovivens sp.]|nr:phenylalanine--tRNA ligase subunit alpha [Candidatus Onthovivens sp.]
MDYTKKFEEIKIEALNEILKAADLKELLDLKNKYLSKKGIVSLMMNEIRNVEDKKVFGEEYNACREVIENKLNELIKVNEEKVFNETLAKESIDLTLPGRNNQLGYKNPFYKIIREVEDIFVGMGYNVEVGPEVDLDKYVFELLNIPKDHPARDMQDTLYINENTLLRSHTSSVQAHVMEKSNGQPIKIICAGKAYRRDDDDVTHSHQFAQIEGLVIDKDINLGNLKATLELFAKKMFSKDVSVRFRSSYFPFTEPSVEVDISCFACHGKGCSTCKGTGWIEILGAGMVNPNVLRMSGYDDKVYSGFAFGIGIERVAMLRYGIDDIRKIYQNDLRFISQFNKVKEE